MYATFTITKEMLNMKGACAAGMRDFIREFPEGVDYQDLLNAWPRRTKTITHHGSWMCSAAQK